MMKAQYTYNLDSTEVNAVLRGPFGLVYRDVQRRGTAVQNRAQQLVPVRTGRLKTSITLEMSTGGDSPTATIGTNMEYARAVHDGRREVRPVNKKVLAWRSGKTGRGKLIFSTKSRSTTGQPFLTKALEAALNP